MSPDLVLTSHPETPAGNPPPGGLAADGFPIDPALQRLARRAAFGHGALALYYVATTPFVLRFMRWGSLPQLAEDLLTRAGLLVPWALLIVGNVVLAACAWRVISLRRWSSWTVVAASAVFAVWACASLGWGMYRSLAGQAPGQSIWGYAVPGALVAGYLICFVFLGQAVSRFNAQRARVLARIEGRIR